jgi:hypothetical protein
LNGLGVTFNKVRGEYFATGGAQGYQSIVTMTVKKYVNGVEVAGWTPAGNVNWTVTSSISGLSVGAADSEAIWKRDADDVVGLTWVADASSSVDGATNWVTKIVQGTAPQGITAYLADVVGSRAVTITASDGSDTSAPAVFIFGKGPLSVFSKTGTADTQWATAGTDDISNGFQAATTPAAYFCSGKHVDNNVMTNGNSDSSSSGFNPNSGNNDWSGEHLTIDNTSYMQRYAETSKLAKPDQLLAVSPYNNSYNSGVQRKGAALAARWSLGNSNVAWTGEVDFYSPYFYAVIVYLDDGDTRWLGSVHTSSRVAVCLQ